MLNKFGGFVCSGIGLHGYIAALASQSSLLFSDRQFQNDQQWGCALLESSARKFALLRIG